MRLTLLVLVLMLLAVACGGEERIVQGLDEFEANEILVVLKARQIEGTKEEIPGRTVTFAVKVDAVDKDDALRILVANRLPRPRPMGLKEVYPQGGGGLIPTKSEEKAKFLMALQGEIERKLMRLPGIVYAHVSVVMPDKDIVRDLDTPPPPATASVAIVFNAIDERGTSKVTEDEVRRLVAASVEDLRPDKIAVVMKQNVPTNLADVVVDDKQIERAPAAAAIGGVRFADKKSYTYASIGLAGAAVVGILILAVGIGGIVRSMSLKRRLARLEADLASMRKAGRATQTGLQQAQ